MIRNTTGSSISEFAPREFSAVRYVRLANPGQRIANTSRRRKPHCWQGIDPAKSAGRWSYPNATSPILRKLVEAIESEPSKRWKQADFRELGIDSATARRQFQKQFGMTFVAYARARRLGIAFQEIRKGSALTHVQLDAGFASSSGFRDAFAKIFGESPKGSDRLLLSAEWLETLLGPMLAIASREHLYLLEFVDRRGLEREVDRLRNRLQAAIVPGSNPVLRLLRRELADYFAGKSFGFTTPIEMVGTPFQKEVWEALLQIPAGESRTYADQAKSLGRSKAVRACSQSQWRQFPGDHHPLPSRSRFGWKIDRLCRWIGSQRVVAAARNQTLSDEIVKTFANILKIRWRIVGFILTSLNGHPNLWSAIFQVLGGRRRCMRPYVRTK